MRKVRISVVIPVYNVDSYIKKCLESLKTQTLSEIEIICVDDCSLDNSALIIQEFMTLDKRIKYQKNQKNIGAGLTRNVGLESAIGEFVFFMDADDEITEKALEVLYTESIKNNLDILCGRFIKIEGDSRKVLPSNFQLIENVVTGLEYLDKLPYLTIVVWNKLWNRKFLIDNSLMFKAIKYEDVIFSLETMIKATRVKNIDFPFYGYLIRENSLMTSSISEENVFHSVNNLKIMEQIVSEVAFGSGKESLDKFFANALIVTNSRIQSSTMSATNLMEYVGLIKCLKSRHLKSFLTNSKISVANKLLLILPLRFASKLYDLVKN